MKKMFLASSFVNVTDLFVKFTGEERKGKTVTFIPTASLVEEVNFMWQQVKKPSKIAG